MRISLLELASVFVTDDRRQESQFLALEVSDRVRLVDYRQRFSLLTLSWASEGDSDSYFVGYSEFHLVYLKFEKVSNSALTNFADESRHSFNLN